MSWKVKILGAGSLGNHMCNATLKKGWKPTLCDIDPQALQRAKESVFPNRYGQWNETIRLAHPDDVKSEDFDLTIIGTPPHTHTQLAIEEIQRQRTKRLLIEKPLCHFNDEKLSQLITLSEKIPCYIGYNHNCSPSHQKVIDLITQGQLGVVQQIKVETLESYEFILGAHPWLNSVHDTYLGSFEKAGGASFEHSHGIAFGLSLITAMSLKPSGSLSARVEFDPQQKFDTSFHFKADLVDGLEFNVTQNFTEKPPIKRVTIMGDQGTLLWEIPYQESRDVVKISSRHLESQFEYKKERPTDFLYELDLIEKDSPIQYSQSLQLGKDVLTLIGKSYQSHQSNERVSFNLC